MIRLLLSLSCAAALTAQHRESLDGPWQVVPEPAAGAAAPAPVAIEVPSAFEAAFGPGFDGVVRYRRNLPLPQPLPPGTRVRVEFAAVATHATVFCNGVEVAQHLGGWTPFRADLTAAVRGRDDVLEVRVDERVGHNTQGFLPIVQPHFGGIWQGVTLCLDQAPVFDRLGLFLFGSGDGTLQFRLPVLAHGADDGELTIAIAVRDGEREVATTEVRTRAGADGAVTGTFAVPEVRRWSPQDPALYTVELRLRAGERELDRTSRRVGFRTLAADGTRVLWNGTPLQVRGVLHWGYSPPHFAPPSDPAFWRRQLQDFRALGFNCLKCCLWVPPRAVYELCDELGLLVWQEYPTWHPKLDQAHKQELLTEYGEFFALDRNHPSVAFRSITCETGHGADLDVVKSLYEACKAAVPQTLVVDDSSWIGWQRITDFWDEHPYGNNSWFPGRLAEFRRHQETAGKKPLLLGECIAADTWFDLAAWRRRHGDEPKWWRPSCYTAQQASEAWLTREFGAATVAALRPWSEEFGRRNRQFQIEQLRLGIPDAGYVVSVARDIPKCRMGLYDELDQLKWSPAEWAWHRDTMLCLDLPWHGRALAGDVQAVPVRLSHFGQGPLRGRLRLWSDQEPRDEAVFDVALQPGELSPPLRLPIQGAPGQLTRIRIHAALDGSHPATSHWDLWRVPIWHYRGIPGVQVVDRLTPAVLDAIEQGARVLLLAGDRPGSLRTESLWFLRGAPFAPDHPLHRQVPADLLLELSSFDLETTRVMPWDLLRDQVDPILAFWETHDLDEVRHHLFAFDCRIGKGRLCATTLRLDADDGLHTLGFHLRYLLEQHLAEGPAPRRELSAATLAALRQKLVEKTLPLPVWRFRTDPQDEGRAAGWSAPTTDTSPAPWRDLRAGSHWENQAEDLRQYTGVAWYRIDIAVPADWQGLAARAVFDGVDDSFELWLNGEPAGSFGDPSVPRSIWLERQVAELGTRLKPGQTNTLVLRVVDHTGSGGIWRPAFLTTGPADATSRLLH